MTTVLRSWKGVAATAVVLVLGGCTSMPKTIADFDEVSKEIDAVSVMPPTFSLGEIGAFSTQTVSEMSHDIEVEIKSCMERLVDESAYSLAVLDASDEALVADPELRQALFTQAGELSLLGARISESKGKRLDVPYNADVDYIADVTDSDHLLMVDGGGWFKTTGARTKEVAVKSVLAAVFGGTPTASPGSGTALRVFLVDANRGQVIWYNEAQVDDRDPRRPSHLMRTCQDLMKPLLGKSSIKPDSSRDDEIKDRYEGRRMEEPATEEDEAEEDTSSGGAAG